MKSQESLKKAEEEKQIPVKKEDTKTVDEKELELSKKQLKDFVERWNSHPNSPYLVGTPVLPNEVLKRAIPQEGWFSRASFASIDVGPPSDHGNDDLSDVENEINTIESSDEYMHYSISQPPAPVTGPLTPNEIVKQLNEKLTKLQNEEIQNKVNGSEDPQMAASSIKNNQPKVPEPLKRPEIIALQREEIKPQSRRGSLDDSQQRRTSVSSSASTKKPPGRDVQVVSTNVKSEIVSPPIGIMKSLSKQNSLDQAVRSSKPPSRNSSFKNDKLRPSRDVQQPEKMDVSQPINFSRDGTPDESGAVLSVEISGSRRSRKTSREERPPSRESDRTTPGKTHRRPSRDVPLSASQLDRLNSLNLCNDTIVATDVQVQMWPDIVAVPQNNDDEDEDDSVEMATPMTVKLELPVMGGQLEKSKPIDIKETHKKDISAPPSPNITENHSPMKKQLSTEEADSAYVPQNKLVAWILDIGTPQRSSPSFGKVEDAFSKWEKRELSPRPNEQEIKSRHRDRSPLPNDRFRDKSPSPFKPTGNAITKDKSSSKVNNLVHNSDNLSINTPWGPLKRSPSRSSIEKSPSRTTLDKSPQITVSSVSIPVEETSLLKEETTKNLPDNSNITNSINKPIPVIQKGPLIPSVPKNKSRSPSPRNSKEIIKVSSEPVKTNKSINSSVPITDKPNNDSKTEASKSNVPSSVPKVVPKPEVNSNSISENKNTSCTIPVTSNTNKVPEIETKLVTSNILKPSTTISSELPPKPPEEKISNSTLRLSNKDDTEKKKTFKKQISIDTTKENELDNSSTLKKTSKTPPIVAAPKKPLNCLLFSAQDRISMFEQKSDDRPKQKPINRTRTSNFFQNQSNDVSKKSSDDKGKRTSICEDRKGSIAPSFVPSKSAIDLSKSRSSTSLSSHVNFMRNKFASSNRSSFSMSNETQSNGEPNNNNNNYLSLNDKKFQTLPRPRKPLK